MKFRFTLVDPEWQGPAQEGPSHGALGYETRGDGMVRVENTAGNRRRYSPLANFKARIVREWIVDDGEEQHRRFQIEAELAGEKIYFELPAATFGRMNWILEKLGPRAIIYPHQQQHTRAAIQSFSGRVAQERIFAHLGWRKDGPTWRYIHAGGAIGPEGAESNVRSQMPPALERYDLPHQADLDEVRRAIRASLNFLALADDRITIPLLAAVYRAPFGAPNFSIFLAGKSGVFKSALAALCQQHFGSGMDATHLPASFSSTANALETLAFQAKDALLVDDYAPMGAKGDAELYQIAERLFRAAGNGQGRTRLDGERNLGSSRPPRALLVATGEQVPSGRSVQARLVVVAVNGGDIDSGWLSECQKSASQGLFATSTAAFLQWIAGRYEQKQQVLKDRVIQLRHHGLGREIHARLPDALAELKAGWEAFLEFAGEVGAVDSQYRQQLEERGQQALTVLSALQAPYHLSTDAATRFLYLLSMALASGKCHVANRRGTAPENAILWGWKSQRPQGPRVGWVCGSDLYLEPTCSYEVAQEQAGGEPLLFGRQVLRSQLRIGGYLASLDQGRKMLQVRRTLEGRARQVLHLKTASMPGMHTVP